MTRVSIIVPAPPPALGKKSEACIECAGYEYDWDKMPENHTCSTCKRFKCPRCEGKGEHFFDECSNCEGRGYQ